MQTPQKQAPRPKMPNLMNKPKTLKMKMIEAYLLILIFMMYSLTVASMNCHGQSKIEVPKHLYIQNFLLTNRIDILLCQETKIDDLTFEQCNFIKSNYNIIKNNASNPYGTSVMVPVNLNI